MVGRSFQARGRAALVAVLTLPLLAVVPVTGSGGPAAAAGPGTELLAWGSNEYGQLGAGFLGGIVTTPVAVSLPPGVSPTSVAEGASNGYALGSDGTVYAWGADEFGQLGNGTSALQWNTTPQPVHLPAGVTVTAVAATNSAGYALTSSGTVYAWGADTDGQLGNGATTGEADAPAPVDLPAGVTVTALAGGADAVYALTAGGAVYAWGFNAYGQLGAGTVTPGDGTPALVDLPAGVTATAVSGGELDGYALTADGTVYAWGDNYVGETGNGGGTTTTTEPTPVVVALPPGVTATAVVGGEAAAYAIGSDHTLYAWGDDEDGALGIGSLVVDEVTPVPVTLAPGVAPTALAAGDNWADAVGSDGRLYAWGNNANGQLGVPVSPGQPTPAPVVLGPGVTPLLPAGGTFADTALLVADPGSTLVITHQPASVTTFPGETATFTAAATGTATPTVQWEESVGGNPFTPIPGATGDTLTVTGLTTQSTGQEYEAVFTTAAGSLTSNPALVTVLPPDPPLIVTPPVGATVGAGQPASFTAAAFSLTGSETVQWEVSTGGGPFTAIPGATQGTYAIAATTPADNGNQYEAVFTNRFGSTTTDPVTLVVVSGSAPAVVGQPAGATVYPGQTVTFTATATGSPTPAVKWQLSVDGGTTWIDVPGLTSPSFTSGQAGLVENGWEVRAVFSNIFGTAVSDPARVMVTVVGGSAPLVVLQPLSQGVAPGQTATFSAAADGVPTPSIRWQLSTDGGATWVDVGTDTSTSFTSAPVVPAESGWEVRAVFSNFLGTAVSDVAVGTVT